MKQDFPAQAVGQLLEQFLGLFCPLVTGQRDAGDMDHGRGDELPISPFRQKSKQQIAHSVNEPDALAGENFPGPFQRLVLKVN